MTGLIVYVVVAIVVSFACSVMEAVLLSVTPAYLALLKQQGDATGELLGALKSKIDRPLVAILSLNTIAHTIGAAGAGAQAAIVFGDTAVGIFSAILTLLILVLSEIVPKTLGAAYWRQLVPIVTPALRLTIAIQAPLVWALEALTRLLSRGQDSQSISREEVRALAVLGAEEGVLEQQESRIFTSLLRFSSMRTHAIMTPRTVLVAAPANSSVADLLEDEEKLRVSRIPIYGTDLDDIHGYVLKDNALLKAAQGHGSLPLKALQRRVLIVPESAPLPKLFELMIKGREHLALVVDEYGGTAGIVTMEDLVETVLGLEILDEVDTIEDMQAHARSAWAERRERRQGLF